MKRTEGTRGEMSPRFERRLDLSLAVALFVLALVPRMLGLDAFLTIDEPAWVSRSARFTQALLRGDFADTFPTTTPSLSAMPGESSAASPQPEDAERVPEVGVTTMWTGAAGLALHYFLLNPAARSEPFRVFLSRIGYAYLPADLLPAIHFPTAFLAALSVALAYLLIRRTFSRTVSLLGGILIALDPFFITHSRIIHHDALTSIFMMLAILALVTYLVTERKSRYLVVAGIASGLAWLSKISALFLGPLFVFLFALAYLIEWRRSPARWRQLLVEMVRGLVVWGLATVATFYILWPGMWVDPLKAPYRLFVESAGLAGAGHFMFFHGQVMVDAGRWFYPVVFLFRTTPLSLIGLVLGLLYLLVGPKDTKREQSGLPWEGWQEKVAVAPFLLFIVTFLIFISFPAKKQDRYLLPTFPFIDLCAAWGLLGMLQWTAGHIKGLGEAGLRRLSTGLTGLCLGAMIVTTAWYHPYYISFYNPLVGGAAQAQKELLIGWGEGMELAGRYLNLKEAAASLTVAAVPFRTFAPFFRGTTTDYLVDNAPALAADYVVTYVSNVQRKGPDLALWEFFLRRKPEAVLRLHGIDYAWLYPGPKYLTRDTPAFQTEVDGNFADKIDLLGYNATPRPGQVRLDLFWKALVPRPEDYSVSIRLRDRAGHYWAQQDGWLVKGLLPTSEITPDYTVRDERMLRLPPGMPAGTYPLEVYVYSAASGKNLPVQGLGSPVPVFALPAGTVTVPKQEARPEDVTPEHRVEKDMADGINLLGYDLGTDPAQPGGTLSPVFYWRAAKPNLPDYRVRLWLESVTSPAGATATVDLPLAGGSYPPTHWVVGDVVKDWQDVPVPAALATGTYRLMAALVKESQGVAGYGSVSLGEVKVEGRSHRFDVPGGIQRPAQANFGGQIEWLGYDMDTRGLKEGKPLSLTLYWRATSAITASYKVFSHVIGPDGTLWGQRDSVPGEGTLWAKPTQTWLKGEVVTDTLQIAIEPKAQAGECKIEMGWYDEATGQRLSVWDERERPLGDHVVLDQTFRWQ